GVGIIAHAMERDDHRGRRAGFRVPFAQGQFHAVTRDQKTVFEMRRHILASQRRGFGGATRQDKAQQDNPKAFHQTTAALRNLQVISPIMDAEIPLANVPETMARKASGTISSRRSGIRALMPAIRMATLPKLAKPHRA